MGWGGHDQAVIIGLIGLGNPGDQYERTRHNIGFRVIDACVNSFPLSKSGLKFKSEFYEGNLSNTPIKAIKPLTFMNLSGHSVQALQSFYKIEPTNIWVIYDDVDLPFGTIRMRQGGSPGTHNGTKHITQTLGTQAFPKIRIGIGPRPQGMPLDAFVLSKFSPAEEKQLPDILIQSTQLIHTAIQSGIQHAMTQFNT
jgi:peptidyl-tRNA hydrolase, PTH1 family